MTESRKLNRLRSLARRIEKATGKKRKFLQREYDLTRRSIGKVVWVSSAPRGIFHMGDRVDVPSQLSVDGTLRKK